MNKKQTTTPPSLWYDYTLQCWIRNGQVDPRGHPQPFRPGCCYAGLHAGEDADPTHYVK